MAIRLSENFVYDVVALFCVHDVMALNNNEMAEVDGRDWSASMFAASRLQIRR